MLVSKQKSQRLLRLIRYLLLVQICLQFALVSKASTFTPQYNLMYDASISEAPDPTSPNPPTALNSCNDGELDVECYMIGASMASYIYFTPSSAWTYDKLFIGYRRINYGSGSITYMWPGETTGAPDAAQDTFVIYPYGSISWTVTSGT